MPFTKFLIYVSEDQFLSSTDVNGTDGMIALFDDTPYKRYHYRNICVFN